MHISVAIATQSDKKSLNMHFDHKIFLFYIKIYKKYETNVLLYGIIKSITYTCTSNKDRTRRL